jgi:hypothetical protein
VKVAIDRDQHEFYRQLIGRSDDDAPGSGIFATMKDVFLVSLGLGVRNGNPVPLQKRVEIFESTGFTAAEWAALEAVYVGLNKNLSGLDGSVGDQRNNELVIRFVEEFANSGVVILRTNVDPRNAEIDLAYLLLADPVSA